jgi:transposase
MWVPPEIRDPVLLHAPTRKSMSCFGAVSLFSGKFVRMLVPKFNTVSFEAFLRKLLRHRSRDRRMVVVLDNATYHHAVALRPLLRKYRRVLQLLFLPPYSPQLAPIERVWKLARRLATHNRYFPILDELVAAVTACFDPWRKPNSVLRRLCGIT